MSVRRADPADLPRIAAIYDEQVRAAVARPNPASEALHLACGFELVGLLPEVGRKLERWIDTALYALVP